MAAAHRVAGPGISVPRAQKIATAGRRSPRDAQTAPRVARPAPRVARPAPRVARPVTRVARPVTRDGWRGTRERLVRREMVSTVAYSPRRARWKHSPPR